MFTHYCPYVSMHNINFKIYIYQSVLVGVQLRGVDDCGTVVPGVLVAVTIADKEEVGQEK